MTGAAGPCPSADRLQGFMAGGLPDAAAAEIEAHIDRCAACREVLSSLARAAGGPAGGDARAELDRGAAQSAAFGRYRLETVLGSGGMGIVYRAWDPQLSRPIAIKVVRHAEGDAAGRARLVREARSLARLSHVNVCHVYDVGEGGDEVWVAMELVDGVNLRQWTAAHPSPRELLPILLGAAEGLAAAHAADVIHRDVKPENVLVTREGRAVVTDFGLARVEVPLDLAASTLRLEPRLTASGAIPGTPAYLAPEQLSGDPLDARVDQFAWALMAWELLTGARPFPIAPGARLDAIRAGVTTPPGISRHVASVLSRALSAAPRDRFPSMRQLIDALRRRPRTRRARRPLGPWVVAAAAAALAVASTLLVWRLVRKPPPAAAPPAEALQPPEAPRPDAPAPIVQPIDPEVRSPPP
jgi:serine/threonine protein kinase